MAYRPLKQMRNGTHLWGVRCTFSPSIGSRGPDQSESAATEGVIQASWKEGFELDRLPDTRQSIVNPEMFVYGLEVSFPLAMLCHSYTDDMSCVGPSSASLPGKSDRALSTGPFDQATKFTD